MQSRTKYLVVVMLTMLLAIAGQSAGPLTPTASAADVIEVQSYGSSYGEWSARWWQWIFAIPKDVNPNLDNDGSNANQGQVDDVWFLAGAFGGTYVRAITIPAKKPIFFPIINSSNMKPWGYETLLDLRKTIADFIDSVNYLKVTIKQGNNPEQIIIEGNPQVDDNLRKYRVRSPSFTVMPPSRPVLPPGVFKVPGNTDALVSDGYWLLLKPLTKDSYVLHFQGKTSGGFGVDVTYNITQQ
jgi:hypothetical protein